MTDVAALVEPRDCPYLGLDYYTEELGGWFFGREAESDKIISNLMGARLTLLHAESGVGKSSVLRAGVAWRLRQYARTAPRGAVMDLPVVFNYWKDDPVRDLIAEIAAAVGPFLPGGAAAGLLTERLDQAIEAAAAAADVGLLVILDQFEEYFVYCSQKSTPERFSDELARCINRANLPAKFLISIREDAYAGLGDLFKGRIANVYGNYLHIDYLDRESAEQAIRRPLEVYNQQPGIAEPVTISGDLVDAVLHEVRVRSADGDPSADQAPANGNPGRVATPLLQLVMQAIWQRELGHGSHELRLSTLQSLEGVGKIVDTHLEQALGTLDRRDQRTAVDMLDHLVTPSGTKIAESVPDLAQRTHQGEDRVGRIMAKLGQARIVRPVQAPPDKDPVRDRRYEILHDALVPAINHKVAARDVQRRTRRIWRLAALALALLLVTLAVVGVFVVLWHNSVIEKRIAQSRELAAEADANATQDPELAVLLALQALHVHYTSQAEDALRTALPGLQAVRTFRESTTVFSAAFDPADANKVASADDNGIAWMWDVRTGRRLAKMSLGGFTATGGAGLAVFNPAGTEVAVAYADGQVGVFDARSGRKLHSARARSPVNGIGFLGSTGTLAIAAQNGLALWAPEHGSRCCHVLSSTPAYTIAANPRNTQEFAVTTATGAFIWNLSSSRRQRLPGGQWSVNDAEFSPNGRDVVTADSDGKVRVYDLVSNTTAMTFDAGELDATSAAFNPNGSQIVAGYSSGMARVWDAVTRLQLTQLAGSAARIETARFSTSGREVVTASDDGTIHVWSARPRELRAEFASASSSGQPYAVGAAEYLRDGRIITLDNSGYARVFTAGGTQQAAIKPPGTTAPGVVWDRAGTKLATADADGTVDVWRAAGSDYTPVRLRTLIRVPGGVQAFDMSPDGSLIAIVPTNDPYTIQIRSGDTGRLLRRLNAHSPPSVLAFSPKGNQIVGADLNGQVEAWAAATGPPRVLGQPGPRISDLEFDQSGSEFVTASASRAVSVWAARGDQPPRRIPACPSPRAAALNPDGSQIVVACQDGTAQVFDAVTGRQLTVLAAATAGVVNWAGFSPDGKSIVTAPGSGGAGGVEVWNSELANPSPSAIERIAEQRVTRQLTPAERSTYLAGISG